MEMVSVNYKEATQDDSKQLKRGFATIRGTLLGVPHNKDRSMLGVHIGVPLVLESIKSMRLVATSTP